MHLRSTVLSFVMLFALVLAAGAVGGCSDESPANPGPGDNGTGDGGGSDSGGDNGGSDSDGSDTGGGDLGGDTGLPDQSTGDDTGGNDTGGTTGWASCVPDPGATELCDDGFDNDCDGLVDEACGCGVSSSTQPCYLGNPAELEAPATACRAGTQTCTLEFWDECQGAVGPAETEICDDEIDNDCDGEIDEGCETDPPVAECPADLTGPVLRDYTLNGGYSDPNGTAMAFGFWSQIEAPPGHSRDITSSGLDLTFFADVAGDYLFELTVENAEGLRDTCQTRVTAITDDVVRIEMYWNPDYDGSGGPDTSDVDLLLRRAPTGNFLYYNNTTIPTDTCYWRNCATCDEPYGDDAGREVECRDFLAGEPPVGHPEGEPWPSPRSEVDWGVEDDPDDDPRLDLDDVEGAGPENINIRRPVAGTYRVAVHYFDEETWEQDGGSAVTVFVRILCAGVEVFSNADSEGVALNVHGNYLENDLWEVGDLTVSYDGETPECAFAQFGGASCHRICRLNESSGGCDPAGCE